MQIVYTLQLPPDVESVPLVRGLVRSSMLQLGVLEPCVDDVALAVTEACANVINHAGGAGSEYSVEVEIDPGDCHIRVIDTGGGFDANSAGAAHDFAESGRGVALMRALVDELHFIPREHEAGTIVHLTKHLDLDGESPLRALSGA
ncbi:MAG TPA: ATP-binding protein [Acidimicrobiales bacterium]|nr:ATP-binding protein [Acidimicrobiales bacterium]